MCVKSRNCDMMYYHSFAIGYAYILQKVSDINTFIKRQVYFISIPTEFGFNINIPVNGVLRNKWYEKREIL